MNIAVCGTRSFGSAVAEALEPILAVYPHDDHKMHSTASRLGVHRADKIDEVMVRGLDIDLIVSAHSHAFIGRRTRNAARIGAIGFHPSLLPRHRGRDAVRWTIHMGDPVAGGTVYWLTDNVDGGPVAAQRHLLVEPGWDHHDLWRRLFPIGVDMLREVVGDLKNGVMVQAEQNERCATWEPSWDRPPLFRPELPEIGAMPNGLTLKTSLA